MRSFFFPLQFLSCFESREMGSKIFFSYLLILFDWNFHTEIDKKKDHLQEIKPKKLFTIFHRFFLFSIIMPETMPKFNIEFKKTKKGKENISTLLPTIFYVIPFYIVFLLSLYTLRSHIYLLFGTIK